MPNSRPFASPERYLPSTNLGQDIADYLAASAAVPECSIIASDIAADAHDLYADGFDSEDTVLRYANQDFAPESAKVDWITKDFTTEGGFDVRLGLAAETTDRKVLKVLKRGTIADATTLKLIAVTRDNIAFPIVRFNRSDKTYCDYLQFWGEDTMSELDSVNFYGWGEDDTGSRYEAVKAVGDVLRAGFIGHTSVDTDNTPGLVALAKTLKFDEIIEKSLGKSDSATETVIKKVFRETLPEEGKTYTKGYHSVKIGRAETDITVVGTLTQNPDDDQKRQFTIRRFPTTQPERVWPETIINIDQFCGMSALQPNGETDEAADLDIRLMDELLSTRGREVATQSRKTEKYRLFGLYARHPVQTFVGLTAANATFKVALEGLDPDILYKAPLGSAIITLGFIALDKVLKENQK